MLSRMGDRSESVVHEFMGLLAAPLLGGGISLFCLSERLIERCARAAFLNLRGYTLFEML
jgi:hypothetical protein